jgi:hypothetical protein
MSAINWWNYKTIANTTRLWKPGLHPIENIHLNTNSWYNASIQKHSIEHETIEQELKEPKEKDIMRKIKINPTFEQRKMLTEWWHAYRYTYNKTIEDIAKVAINEDTTICAFIKPSTEESVTLELGSRFELPTKWKVKIKVLDPKVTVRFRYTKTKGVRIDIKVVQEEGQLKVSFHFAYPPIDYWTQFRDKYVTAPTLPLLKVVDKRIRASACKDACANYKTICTLAEQYNKRGTIGSLPFKPVGLLEWKKVVLHLFAFNETIKVEKNVNERNPI